jgi:hypothetical protein
MFPREYQCEYFNSNEQCSNSVVIYEDDLNLKTIVCEKHKSFENFENFESFESFESRMNMIQNEEYVLYIQNALEIHREIIEKEISHKLSQLIYEKFERLFAYYRLKHEDYLTFYNEMVHDTYSFIFDNKIFQNIEHLRVIFELMHIDEINEFCNILRFECITIINNVIIYEQNNAQNSQNENLVLDACEEK